jgi:hypothetical protein
MPSNYVFPKNCLKKGAVCDACGKKSMYELDVPMNNKLYDKDFCTACKNCMWCNNGKATPENICSECYCPKCGVEHCFVIYKADLKANFATMDQEKKKKLINDHVKNCDGVRNVKEEQRLSNKILDSCSDSSDSDSDSETKKN